LTDDQLLRVSAAQSAAWLLIGLLLSVWFFSGWPIGLTAILAVSLLAASRWHPPVAHKVHSRMTRLSEAIGRLISLVAMAFVFYVVVTPIGWIGKRFSRPWIVLEPEPAAVTYWVDTEDDGDPEAPFRPH
ncbi:MAG: hypothetical protein AAGA03_08325, partial [Planctomycetota bacterium]